MARIVYFSLRFTVQLQNILTFYDERNGTDLYSRRLMKCLTESINRITEMPTASSPSTRPDIRFFYLMGFTIIFRFNSRQITMLSIRSSERKPLRIYRKK
jgi:hypothetical protein